MVNLKIKSRFLLLFLVLTVGLLVTPLNVKAAPGDYWISLTFNKTFYYVGDIITVQAISNISVSTQLTIFWSWNISNPENIQVYQDVKTANATWNLPSANLKPGHYKFFLETPKYNVTAWKSLVHLTNYIPSNLPFSYVWNNVNYTLQGRTLKAETQTDYIEVHYPKIPFDYTVNFYRNNMSFIVRLHGGSWDVDIGYFTIYGGLKWTINGTLYNPGTFEFQCAHNPLQIWKKYLESFKSSSSLTFSWRDIKKAAHVFTWNPTTKTLSVEIPSTFNLDPEIFSDGFESGDFTAWSGTSGSPTVQSSVVYSGSYAMYVDAAEYAYKDLGSSYATAYAGLYIRFDNLIEEQYYYSPFLFLGASSNWAYATAIDLYCYDGSNHHFRITDGASGEDEGTTIVSSDTWYYIELLRKTGSGSSVMYVDGSEEASLDYGYYDSDRVQAGGDFALSSSAYIDYVRVNTEYMGPVEEGPIEREVSATITNTSAVARYISISPSISETTILTASINAVLNFPKSVSAIITITSALTRQLLWVVSSSATITITEAISTGSSAIVNAIIQITAALSNLVQAFRTNAAIITITSAIAKQLQIGVVSTGAFIITSAVDSGFAIIQVTVSAIIQIVSVIARLGGENRVYVFSVILGGALLLSLIGLPALIILLRRRR